MKTLMIVVIGLAATQAMAPQEKQFDLDLNNKENVVASRLTGTWKYNVDLTIRLSGRAAKAPEGVGKEESVSFTSDKTAIPDEELKKLAGRVKMKLTIYAIGKMKWGDKEYPYFLTSLHGNPHVIHFRERGGDPFGDAESFNVMLAKAKETESDMLFIGGDFNNEPFSALERTK